MEKLTFEQRLEGMMELSMGISEGSILQAEETTSTESLKKACV